MITLKWEAIQDACRDLKGHTWRAKVFGGWLIKSLDVTRTVEVDERRVRRSMPPETHEVENVSMTFIPDPSHVWDTADKLFKDI